MKIFAPSAPQQPSVFKSVFPSKSSFNPKFQAFSVLDRISWFGGGRGEGGRRGEDRRRRVVVGGGGAEIGGRGEGRPGSIKPFIRNIEAWVLGFVMMIEPAHPPPPPQTYPNLPWNVIPLLLHIHFTQPYIHQDKNNENKFSYFRMVAIEIILWWSFWPCKLYCFSCLFCHNVII